MTAILTPPPTVSHTDMGMNPPKPVIVVTHGDDADVIQAIDFDDAQAIYENIVTGTIESLSGKVTETHGTMFDPYQYTKLATNAEIIMVERF